MKTKEKAIGLAIVEDTSDIREVLVAYFSRQEDIQLIYAASDAEDLFQHADFTQINLVICDIGLPHINGVEACWLIKQQYRAYLSMIFLLTKVTRATFLSAWMLPVAETCGFLIKPLTILQ